MGQEFTIASFRDVSDGLQAGQFDVGDRKKAVSLSELDPIYKQLLDKQWHTPVRQTMHIIEIAQVS